MKERKHMDELNVAERFILIYNKINGTDFGNPYKPQDDDSVDAEAASRSNPSAKLRMQVTKSDPDPDLWQALREEAWFERGESGSEGVFNRLLTAIMKKAEKYPPKSKGETILLLDGWPGVLKEQVKMFKAQYGDQARATGFAEIWFVGLSEDAIIRIA